MTTIKAEGKAADVLQFGILMQEIFFDDPTSSDKQDFKRFYDVSLYSPPKKDASNASASERLLLSLINVCCLSDPKQRPDFVGIMSLLDSIRLSLKVK